MAAMVKMADWNKTQGETLQKLQKRFVGIIAGQGGHYHADPLFAKFGIYNSSS
jgi:hypothetical protein